MLTHVHYPLWLTQASTEEATYSEPQHQNEPLPSLFAFSAGFPFLSFNAVVAL